MSDTTAILIDRLGDAPFPNSSALAREAWMQLQTLAILRDLLARVQVLEAASPSHNTSTASPPTTAAPASNAHHTTDTPPR
jgi:hypothetical protein